jgi:ABC-2 type transport system ATP-binding protein
LGGAIAVNIIKAVGVSILYLTGDFKDIGLKEYVMRRLKGNYHVTQFWADRNINFSLAKGDMLGIIGTNGAGKSTLLKAVSGIMVPTEGHMEINGSIAALLELASGFDPELTVRENTYLRGAMLGYTRKFMNDKYEEIIDFAELQDFQDRPFKQLSSGMKSRLAFSIACLVHPDILILDEVLSVGDGAFAKKSGDRMREILKSGVTGILVSHSVPQVRSMCNKILWLDHGHQVGFSDQVEAYCDAYEEFLITKKLPHTSDEIQLLAEDFHKRIKRERELANRTEAQRLEDLLNKGDSDAALQAAVSIIKKKRPELLR